MDGPRFDGLAKAAAGSRRGVLRVLLGLVLGGGLSGIGDRESEAKRCREKGRQCRAHDDCCTKMCLADDGAGPPCDSPLEASGRRTRRRCRCGEPLGGSECQTSADCGPADIFTCCNGTCLITIDLLGDNANCGACGNACAADANCLKGSCCPDSLSCNPGPGALCCPEGSCCYFEANPNTCGVPCPFPGPWCCPPGSSCCNGACCAGPCCDGPNGATCCAAGACCTEGGACGVTCNGECCDGNCFTWANGDVCCAASACHNQFGYPCGVPCDNDVCCGGLEGEDLSCCNGTCCNNICCGGQCCVGFPVQCTDVGCTECGGGICNGECCITGTVCCGDACCLFGRCCNGVCCDHDISNCCGPNGDVCCPVGAPCDADTNTCQ